MAAIVAVLLLTPLGERPLIALLPIGDVAAVDFATLKLTDKPNQYLVCPPGLCTARAHGVRCRWTRPHRAVSSPLTYVSPNGDVRHNT